eukprot:7448158-Alexandrium_andersonii.AAC.1
MGGRRVPRGPELASELRPAGGGSRPPHELGCGQAVVVAMVAGPRAASASALCALVAVAPGAPTAECVLPPIGVLWVQRLRRAKPP